MVSQEISDLIHLAAQESKNYTDLVQAGSLDKLENSLIFKSNLDRLESLVASLEDIDYQGGTADITKLISDITLNKNSLILLRDEYINNNLTIKELIETNTTDLQHNQLKFTRIFEILEEHLSLIESKASTGTTSTKPIPDKVIYGTPSTNNIMYRWDIFILDIGFKIEQFNGVSTITKIIPGSIPIPSTPISCSTLIYSNY